MKARWREQLVNFPTKELWNQGKSMCHSPRPDWVELKQTKIKCLEFIPNCSSELRH